MLHADDQNLSYYPKARNIIDTNIRLETVTPDTNLLRYTYTQFFKQEILIYSNNISMFQSQTFFGVYFAKVSGIVCFQYVSNISYHFFWYEIEILSLSTFFVTESIQCETYPSDIWIQQNFKVKTEIICCSEVTVQVSLRQQVLVLFLSKESLGFQKPMN